MPRNRKTKPQELAPPVPPASPGAAPAAGEPNITVVETATPPPARRASQQRRPRTTKPASKPPAVTNGAAAPDSAREALTAVQAEASALLAELAQTMRELKQAREQLTEGSRRATQETTSEVSRLRQQCADAHSAVRDLTEEIGSLRDQVNSLRTEPPVAPPPLPTPAPNPEPAEPRNLLGVTVGPGVVVAEVSPESPAARAGLQPGDLVLAVEDRALASGAQLRELVQARRAEGVTLRIGRAGDEHDIEIAAEPSSDAPQSPESDPRLGVEVAPGVVVAEVLPGTPAEEAGLAPGDIITGVGGTAVHTGLQLRELVLNSATNGRLAVQARRGPEEMAFIVALGEATQPG